MQNTLNIKTQVINADFEIANTHYHVDPQLISFF